MSLYLWSKIANNDATADPSINWQEGQAPSTVNDSARAMMAATAKFRDDISGALVTGGSPTAFVASSNQGFTSYAAMDKMMIAFTAFTTNNSIGLTFNIDGLGVKAVRAQPGVEIPPGTIIQGTPYEMVYNNADGCFYLKGFYGNPYAIPLGSTIEYWLSTTPNSSFVFPFGQAISRTTYATLFAAMGTTYGTGDGSTTFNLPDLRGRVVGCIDNMGGFDAARLSDSNSSIAVKRNTMGGTGGSVTHQNAVGEIPQLAVSVSGNVSVNSTRGDVLCTTADLTNVGLSGGGSVTPVFPNTTTSTRVTLTSTGSNTMTGQANTGVTAATHENVQPTILCNRIMRII